MGNYSQVDDVTDLNYHRTSTLILTSLTKNALRAQQSRSYQLSYIYKHDIFDYRNEFRNKISKFIRKQNMKTDTIEELEEAVIKDVKHWITTSRPRMITDEVWRVFYKRQLVTKHTFSGFIDEKGHLTSLLKSHDEL